MMNLPKLREMAALYDVLIVTNHASGYIAAADIWAISGENKERICMTGNLTYKKPQEIVAVLERVSGKKTAELWGKP